MKYYLGIDLGGSKIASAVVDPAGRVISEYRLNTEGSGGVNSVIDRMVQAALAAVQQAEIEKEEILGIGVGAPGSVDPVTGAIENAVNLPGWDVVPLGTILAERLQLPVKVDNDANVAALAENLLGAGRGCSDLIYLTVSTGIGGGLIVDGRLLHGANGLAGEVGHMVLDPDGPACSCGGRGCLEAFSSGTAVAWEAERLLQCGFDSVLRERMHGNKIKAEHVFAASRQGDALARNVVNRTIRYLAIGIANLINILNPQRVVIGGGVAKAGDALFNPLREQVFSFAIGKGKNTEIVPAVLGDQAGVVGAALLSMVDK